MAKYIGPVCKLCRREQTKLFLKGDKCYTKCVLEKRPGGPGMAKPQRGKPSAYAIRLREKQKLRRLVSIAERPFERLVASASRSPENSGEFLLRSLLFRHELDVVHNKDIILPVLVFKFIRAAFLDGIDEINREAFR